MQEGEDNYFELEKLSIETIKKLTNVKISINELDFIRRIGKRANGKPRPVVIGFIAWRMKLIIMKNKNVNKTDNLYITDDFPKKVLNEGNELKEQLDAEHKKGNIAFIRYNKLVVKESNEHQAESEHSKKRYSSKSPSRSLKRVNRDKKLCHPL